MSRISSLIIKPPTKIIRVVEIFVFCLVCAVTIFDWLGNLYLSADSTSYITASNSLVKTGKLSFLVNFTDWYKDPTVLPFTEQPPGFPLFLAPFILVLREPILSAAIAQSVAIALYFVVIYSICIRLEFTPILRMTALLIFTFLDPFRIIFNAFWTETLFIAISVAAGLVAVRLMKGRNRRSDWILFLALLALSSTVKFTGVANLALIALILLQQDSFRVLWRLLTHRYLALGLAIGGGTLGLLSLLADTLSDANPGIGPLQLRGIVLGFAGLLIGMTSLLLRRKERIQPPANALRKGDMSTAAWAVAAAAAAISPVLIWFTRNKLLYGDVTLSHALFDSFYADNLAVPIRFIWNELFSTRGVPQPVVAVLIIALLLVPFSQGTYKRRATHISILSAGFAHFMAVWLISLVASFSEVEARYLSPALAFGILGILHGLQQAIESLRPRKWRHLLVALPLGFLILSESVSVRYELSPLGKINYPVEMQLWEELERVDWIRSSTHFYAEGSWKHQIFAGIPMGLIWETGPLQNPKRLNALLSSGQDPFILLKTHSRETTILEDTIASGGITLDKIVFPELGYVIYFTPK